MEARQGDSQHTRPRDNRMPRLAEVPPADGAGTVERDASELMARLEAQAAENRSLTAKVDSLERAHAAVVEELERVRESAAAGEAQLQRAWAHLAEAQRPLASHDLGFLGKLLRNRAPGA